MDSVAALSASSPALQPPEPRLKNFDSRILEKESPEDVGGDDDDVVVAVIDRLPKKEEVMATTTIMVISSSCVSIQLI